MNSCQKKRLTKVEAMLIVALAESRKRSEKRWYWCRKCKAYHTTSKDWERFDRYGLNRIREPK